MATLREEPSEGLFEHVIAELVKELTRNDSADFDEKTARRAAENLPLVTYCESTSRLIMEPWQVHLCTILQTLIHTRGRRILFHKPPQHGGSVVVSQRFPSYAIGHKPDLKVGIACHNIEKATEFAAVNKMTMLSSSYLEMFHENKEGLYIPSRASDKNFSTRARRAHRDAQWSVSALGLQTGFVGKGVDLLIIDDPYASPQEALSKAARANIWTFWTQGAKVRVDANGNIIIMFHRYHEDDFVGQLIKEEGLKSMGGVWELYSYRAQWDGDERPVVGGPDPIGRKVGEYLSPRKAKQPEYYKEQQRNPSVWLSQFQGKPSRDDGSMFKANRMLVVPTAPTKFTKVARAWDVASTEDGDYTVGTLEGLGEDEYVYVLDVIRFRKDTDERNKIIRRTANRDRVFYPDIVTVLPQDPGGAGKDVTKMWEKLMKGHIIKIVQSFNRGSKEQKAVPWSAYVNSGYVRLVCKGDINAKDDDGKYISWVLEFIDEHKRFLAQDIDDQVDSASDAFNEIALDIENPPGEDFDTIGLYKEETTGIQLDPETQEELLHDYLGSVFDMLPEFFGYEGEVFYGKQNAARSLQVSNLNREPAVQRHRHTSAQRKRLQSSKTRRVKYFRSDND